MWRKRTKSCGRTMQEASLVSHFRKWAVVGQAGKKKTPTKKDEVLVRDVEPKQKMCLCVRTGWTAVVISDLKESRKVEIKLWWENPAASVHELQTMAITFGLNPSQCRINGQSFKKQSSLFFFFFCFNCKEEATTPLRSTFPLQHAGSRPQMVNDCQKMC